MFVNVCLSAIVCDVLWSMMLTCKAKIVSFVVGRLLDLSYSILRTKEICHIEWPASSSFAGKL